MIKEGTRILISSWGIQNDPDYFPDPAKFDPDRFSDDNKKNIQPYTFIPFGEGPRICIGKLVYLITVLHQSHIISF